MRLTFSNLQVGDRIEIEGRTSRGLATKISGVVGKIENPQVYNDAAIKLIADFDGRPVWFYLTDIKNIYDVSDDKGDL